MAKKLRMLRTAKSYIKKHEGELAQSKQAKDIFATWSNWFRNVSSIEGRNIPPNTKTIFSATFLTTVGHLRSSQRSVAHMFLLNSSIFIDSKERSLS